MLFNNAFSNSFTQSSIILFGKILFFSLFFYALLYLTFHQAYNEEFSRVVHSHLVFSHPSDTPQHLEIMHQYINGEKFLAHPLWHLLVFNVSSAAHIEYATASSIVSSFLIMLWMLIVYYLVNARVNQYYTDVFEYGKAILTLSATFSICIIGPFYFPYLSDLIYKGQGSPNVWHNVTLWTVKPLALLAFLFTMRGLKMQKLLDFAAAFIFSVTSIFAKPSFIMIFLPSLLLLISIKRFYSKRTLVYMSSLCLAASLVMLYQYLNVFEGGRQIIFDYFGVWSLRSQNIPLSIVSALAFPLLFLIIMRKEKIADELLASWLLTFFGLVLFACFAESGPKYSHGNFGWSYKIAMSILYLFSILEFIKKYSQFSRLHRYALLFLLVIQTGIGAYYFGHVLAGENPIYITF